MDFSYTLKCGNFWSVSVEHLIEHKHLFSEEWASISTCVMYEKRIIYMWSLTTNVIDLVTSKLLSCQKHKDLQLMIRVGKSIMSPLIIDARSYGLFFFLNFWQDNFWQISRFGNSNTISSLLHFGWLHCKLTTDVFWC